METKSKEMDRNERVRFIILVITFIGLAVATQHAKAMGDRSPSSVSNEAYQSQLVNIKNKAKEDGSFKLRTNKGTYERFAKGKAKSVDTDTLNTLRSAGVSLSGPKYLCKTTKSTPWREIRRVETELELSYLIDVLQEQEMPRALSDEQRVILTKVPNCAPYIDDLRVISGLLKGHTLMGAN